MNTPSAARFHALHHQPLPLRLPNAWDAGSARQIEMLGAQAIATTSAGVAWSLGYRDGNQLPVAEYVARVASIARAIGVPLSTDIEGGYHEHPATVADTVRRMIDVGVVGINIEDGSADPLLLCRKWRPSEPPASAQALSCISMCVLTSTHAIWFRPETKLTK